MPGHSCVPSSAAQHSSGLQGWHSAGAQGGGARTDTSITGVLPPHKAHNDLDDNPDANGDQAHRSNAGHDLHQALREGPKPRCSAVSGRMRYAARCGSA